MRRLFALLLLCSASPAFAVDRIVNITDCSGSITAGGVSQVAVAQRTDRDFLFIQNPADAVETLFVNYGTSASTTAKNSVELLPGGSINFQGTGVPISSVTINALTIGHSYICKTGGVF